jgi:hypothetical protein
VSSQIFDDNTINKLVSRYDVLLLVFKDDQWIIKSIFGRSLHYVDPDELELLFLQLLSVGYARYEFQDDLVDFGDDQQESGNWRCYVLTRSSNVQVVIPEPVAVGSTLVSDTRN